MSLPRIKNGSELATALGVNVRSLNLYRSRGLDLPAAGESIEAWAKRAKNWIRSSRKKTGPKAAADVPGSDASKWKYWDWRFKRSRALRQELELKKARGKLHSKEECEAEQAERHQAVVMALRMLPDKGARRLYQLSPEAIKIVLQQELRTACDHLKRRMDGEEEASQDETVA